jgi:hypothetical protein
MAGADGIDRMLRLFPMYWVAHLIYLVLPFQAHLEPMDYRFILSFPGDRIVPTYTIFNYANPACWYFDLILGLYIVFPSLFRLLQKGGAGWFLAVCGLETVASRYLLLFVIPSSDNWLLGGSCGRRLWEFALGVMGLWYRHNRARVDASLFSPVTLIAGASLYTAGFYSYEWGLTYTLTDALIGTGLFIILAQIAYGIRWRLLLWALPDPPAVRYLPGRADAEDVSFPVHRYRLLADCGARDYLSAARKTYSPVDEPCFRGAVEHTGCGASNPVFLTCCEPRLSGRLGEVPSFNRTSDFYPRKRSPGYCSHRSTWPARVWLP